MNIKKQFYLIVTSVLFFAILGLAHGWSSTAFAEEGGAVVTDGEITFYEDTTEEPPSISSSSGVKPTPTVVKPKGKLPSTGELIKKSFGITGGALILFVAVLFFLKRKKEQDREGNEHD